MQSNQIDTRIHRGTPCFDSMLRKLVNSARSEDVCLVFFGCFGKPSALETQHEALISWFFFQILFRLTSSLLSCALKTLLNCWRKKRRGQINEVIREAWEALWDEQNDAVETCLGRGALPSRSIASLKIY